MTDQPAEQKPQNVVVATVALLLGGAASESLFANCSLATPKFMNAKLGRDQEKEYRHEIDPRFDGCCTYALRGSSSSCGISEDRQRGIRHVLRRKHCG